jgi:hypothetical protein
MRLQASQLSGSVGPHRLLESEGDWLPGVGVSPPWPYLIRLPLFRVVPAMRNKIVYRLTQNAGFVSAEPLRDPAYLRSEHSIGDIDKPLVVSRHRAGATLQSCRSEQTHDRPLSRYRGARWVHRPVADSDSWPGLAPVRSAAARRPTVASLGHFIERPPKGWWLPSATAPAEASRSVGRQLSVSAARPSTRLVHGDRIPGGGGRLSSRKRSRPSSTDDQRSSSKHRRRIAPFAPPPIGPDFCLPGNPDYLAQRSFTVSFRLPAVNRSTLGGRERGLARSYRSQNSAGSLPPEARTRVVDSRPSPLRPRFGKLKCSE